MVEQQQCRCNGSRGTDCFYCQGTGYLQERNAWKIIPSSQSTVYVKVIKFEQAQPINVKFRTPHKGVEPIVIDRFGNTIYSQRVIHIWNKTNDLKKNINAGGLCNTDKNISLISKLVDDIYKRKKNIIRLDLNKVERRVYDQITNYLIMVKSQLVKGELPISITFVPAVKRKPHAKHVNDNNILNKKKKDRQSKIPTPVDSIKPISDTATDLQIKHSTNRVLRQRIQVPKRVPPEHKVGHRSEKQSANFSPLQSTQNLKSNSLIPEKDTEAKKINIALESLKNKFKKD